MFRDICHGVGATPRFRKSRRKSSNRALEAKETGDLAAFEWLRGNKIVPSNDRAVIVGESGPRFVVGKGVIEFQACNVPPESLR
jgi:hypothetical protein